ncbi:hypothetical protein DYQ86_09005 [Acidobacteria bacterium AB60]|nr:hypothetical protein DYQ86_09005 [Acidobacteria bacterium AB60]
MIEPEETRKEPYLVETWQREPARNDLTINEVHGQESRDSRTRAVGSPLPMGSPRAGQEPAFRPAPPQGRSLSGTSADDHGMQRAMSVLKQAMPFVHKLLPLIDGNIATAVANLFAPRTHGTPSPTVDLAPVQTQITELQAHSQDLRTQMQEQSSSLKRVEDQLDMVREATDRNTLEQQELIEDLKAVGNKVNLFALLLFAMLIVSLVLNVMLYLHVKQVLP